MPSQQEKEPSLEQLIQWDRQHVWHAFSQMAEYDGLIIQSAEGVWLTDLHGHRYLDGVSSLWCNVHGHRHPSIDQAILQQLNQVAHVTSLGMSHPTTIRLAKRLVDLSPNGLEHCFFSSDGSSAIEVALKLAFQYWRQCDAPEPDRTTYLALGNSYHGDTLGSVAVGGVSRFHAMFDPLLFPVMRGPCPDTYRLPSGIQPDQGCDYYLAQYEKILRQHSHRLAAMIVEPLVQGAAGIVLHPSGFLSGLRRLTQQYGVLLIADEVAVGMGRTGTLFACEQEQVQPDFLCLGKGLSGGYLPMSATLTTTKIWDAFLGDYEQSKSFFHGHTYGGNPLAAAAALATFDVFEQERTLELLPAKAKLLGDLLHALTKHPHVGNVRQCGMIAAVELVADKATQLGYPWSEKRGLRACLEARRHQVWLRPLGNVIPIMPPLSITEAELRQLIHAVEQGIQFATQFD